jgi:hypothetical protein
VDEPDPSAKAFSPSVEHVVNLLERIQAGDHGLLPELRLALNDHPEVWKSFGDLGQHAREAWLTLVAGPDLGFRECLRRKIADDERAIAGHDASRLESMMATRVVLTALQVSHADSMVALKRVDSIKQEKFLADRQDRAHRRHLSSIALLATLRRLAPPAQHALDGPPPPDSHPDSNVSLARIGPGQGAGHFDDRPCTEDGQPRPSRVRPAAAP